MKVKPLFPNGTHDQPALTHHLSNLASSNFLSNTSNMFTGLIEHLGKVSSVQLDEAGCTMTIADAAPILGDCHIGDSIAVNGACLTVTEFDAAAEGGWFKVWLANETLERTDLGERKVGDQVNLERAMAAHVRFGGHFVQAHVDTTATIVERTSDGDSLRLTFEFGNRLPHGYVTIDGASLTVTGVDDARRRFSVVLIQHTQEKISLGTQKRVGSTVNIEVDMVGKYVEKSVVAALGSGENTHLRAMVEKIVESVLAKKGLALQGFVEQKCSRNRGQSSRSGRLFHLVEMISEVVEGQVIIRWIATAKITVVKVTESSPQRNHVSRSPSPYKNSAPSPVFRPKAKVNSSATSSLVARKATSTVSSTAVSRTASVRSAASTSTLRTGVSLTPRSASPSKQPSSVPRPRAAITRGVTARVGAQEQRRGSLSGDPRASPSIASASPIPVSDLLDLSDDEQESPVASPRITAKLSRRNSSELASSSPPLPPHIGSLRAQPNRARVHSISSNASSSSSPFYSGSSATPAANPHRFPSARASPPSSAVNYYQPFPRDDTNPKTYPRVNGYAKVDPTAIPLPPHSPPTSTVSYSSRSSLSPSSVSYRTAPRGNARDAADSSMRTGLENLMHFSGMLPTAEDGGEDDSDEDENQEEQLRASTVERKVRAEAKSVRKIADLEITNRSLLTINTSLEQTKHRQAKEIRELRRKLRESRLILPPRAFRAVKSSLEHDDTADDDDEDDDDDGEEETEEAEKAREAQDVTYRRIKVILEGLLESGRRALETTPQDFPEPVKVTKVLSAYEVPHLHADDENENENDDEQPPEAARAPASPSHVAVPDSSDDDTGMFSEDEVEAMTLPCDSPPPSHPPSPLALAGEIEPAPA
ncbi:hypothetical protein MVEN_01515700 [Mycena venus]|uniref:Riboflavin synthase n=1 Tax=Mycena venus TaxID=2733690 RepID=A0A8H7CRJ9_9AGAR|nr:hypothetical protein MVEN_01515700 [Mycena venus]